MPDYHENNCCAMETVTESRCCRKIDEIAATIEAGEHSCITDHCGYRLDCLDVLLLQLPTWHTKSNIVTCIEMETGTEICAALLC